jgi:hypothetical protein
MVWMVSSSFCTVLSLTSIARGIGFVPLSCIFTACIYSKTCLILANSFCILPLWFSTSLNSSVVRSCTLSPMRSTSSLVIVYSMIFLWALAFLRGPPVCIIGHLGGPVSCGVASEGVSYIVVYPLNFSSYTRALSFFSICTSFFRTLPFFYCTGF